MKSRARILLTSLIAFGLFASSVSSATAASSSFETKREAYEKVALRSFYTMDKSLNGIVLYYVNSDNETSWSDEKPSELFTTFLAAYHTYYTEMNSFLDVVIARVPVSKKKAAAALKRTKALKKCRATRKPLQRARFSFGQGVSNIALIAGGVDRSTDYLETVLSKTKEILPLIDGTKRSFTDGYEDNAVYVFGPNKIKVDMPGDPDPVPIDPEQVAALSDALWSWDNELIDLQEARFVKFFDAAVKQVGKARIASRKHC